MGQATPLSELVGANVRYWREWADLSQEQLARRLRDYGLAWDHARVGRAERGEREPTVAQLVLLAAALDLPSVQLLLSPEPMAGPPVSEVALSAQATISAELLERVLDPEAMEGRPFRWEDEGLDVPSPSDLEAVRRGAAHEVEQRVARALGVSPTDVARAALDRYGCSLVVEREARVERMVHDDPRGWRALRGVVTRKLTEELRENMQLWLRAERELGASEKPDATEDRSSG